MLHANLKTTFTLIFVTGFISFSIAQSKPFYYAPDYLRKTDNDRLKYDLEHGRDVPYFNGITSKENQTSSTGSQAVGNFMKITNFDQTAVNKTETGKMLLSRYAAEAEQGNEEKMIYMALTYRVFLQDEKNEIMWLNRLVEKNNMYALMRRGDLFEDAKDIHSSIKLYEQAAATGNDVAMVGLAEKYILYVKDEIKKPVELLTAAAAKDNMEACMVLGNLYNGLYGKQYPREYAKAMNFYLKYLQLSDKQTDSDIIDLRSKIMQSIAVMYKNGNGVAADEKAYRQWMKRSNKEEKRSKG